MPTTFTAQQIADFHTYVRVQRSTHHNMLSAGAISATGLGKERHLFVIDSYFELAEAVAAELKAAEA